MRFIVDNALAEQNAKTKFLYGISWIAALTGLMFIVILTFESVTTLSLVMHGTVRVGEVIDVRIYPGRRYSHRYEPTVKFIADNGNEISFTSKPVHYPYHSGEQVPVVYDPEDFNKAEICLFRSLWEKRIGLLLLSGILLFFGLYAIFSIYVKKFSIDIFTDSYKKNNHYTLFYRDHENLWLPVFIATFLLSVTVTFPIALLTVYRGGASLAIATLSLPFASVYYLMRCIRNVPLVALSGMRFEVSSFPGLEGGTIKGLLLMSRFVPKPTECNVCLQCIRIRSVGKKSMEKVVWSSGQQVWPVVVNACLGLETSFRIPKLKKHLYENEEDYYKWEFTADIRTKRKSIQRKFPVPHFATENMFPVTETGEIKMDSCEKS